MRNDNSGWPAPDYGDAIAHVYDEWFDTRRLPPDAAVERLADLAGDGPVLELGIGTGRVALPLSARGLAVTGSTPPPRCWTGCRPSRPPGRSTS
jgi:ubiquinone/menaquinone biosynthesis C-methylase UbiE